MGRPSRSAAAGTWFHVVNRGAARADIFLSDRDRVEFGRLLGVVHDRFEIHVHAYCLMGNHYHLLIETPSGRLSDAMHHIGGVYARHLNERLGRDGPVFRGRYFGRTVLSTDYLLRVVRYIHRNPLSFVDASDLETYRWSSLRTYLGYRRRPTWLRTDVVSELTGGVDGMRALVGSSARTPVAIGASDLACAIDVLIDEHLGDAHPQGVARTVKTLLLDRLLPDGSEALRAELDFPSVNAERSARSRARRRLREVPALEHIVEGVVDLMA
jgi:REP element-mobilizing transposase RayT